MWQKCGNNGDSDYGIWQQHYVISAGERCEANTGCYSRLCASNRRTGCNIYRNQITDLRD